MGCFIGREAGSSVHGAVVFGCHGQHVDASCELRVETTLMNSTPRYIESVSKYVRSKSK